MMVENSSCEQKIFYTIEPTCTLKNTTNKITCNLYFCIFIAYFTVNIFEWIQIVILGSFHWILNFYNFQGEGILTFSPAAWCKLIFKNSRFKVNRRMIFSFFYKIISSTVQIVDNFSPSSIAVIAFIALFSNPKVRARCRKFVEEDRARWFVT